MSATGIGASVRRKEDQRFITGKGHYTDDINRPGQAYACFLRSPHAHARIKVDASKARAFGPADALDGLRAPDGVRTGRVAPDEVLWVGAAANKNREAFAVRVQEITDAIEKELSKARVAEPELEATTAGRS